MAKGLEKKLEKAFDNAITFNPLLAAIHENDKKNLFTTNVNTVYHKTGFHLFDYFFGSVINVHDDLGRIISQEPRVGQAAGTFNLVIGNSGSGKAQPLSSNIPTPYGYKKMGDIRIGDEVYGSDGSIIKVTGIFPQGPQECYTITLSDGRTTKCTMDHLWTIFEDGKWVTKPLSEIVDTFNTTGKKAIIPSLSRPVDKFIVSPLSPELIYDIHKNYDMDEPIEEIYKNNDTAGKLYLLAALVDSRGILSEYDKKYSLTLSGFKEQIEDIKYIAYSLGLTDVSVDDTDKGIIGITIRMSKDIYDWFVDFNRDAIPASLWNDGNVVTIENVKYSHVEKCQCIKVDSKDELYLTDDFIVTHNTTLTAQIAANIIRQYEFANVIHFDCEERFDMSRCEIITGLPAHFFYSNGKQGERYIIRSGRCGLDTIQEMIVKIYVNKMKLKDQLIIDSGFKDEFGKPIMTFPPTVGIIDSITTVLNETFNPDNSKEASDAEKMRSNTDGARDAKSLKGFFKDIIPLCKEANIIIYGINHINQNMSMNAFTPVAKQQNFLKQDEIIPGGKTMIFYPFNIIKLTAKPSDDFTEEGDGFAGHIVMVEPIKSSSNQSGNNSKGISFELVFNFKYGFDPLLSLINYGVNNGIIEGNRNRMKFKDHPDYTFSRKNINQDKKEKPIWEDIKKYIIPTLNKHLPFIEPNHEFDENIFDY